MPDGFESTIGDLLFYSIFFGFCYVCYKVPVARIFGYGVIFLLVLGILVRRFITIGFFTDLGTDLAYIVVIAGACLLGKDADDRQSKM